jgi:hypothetical protein
MSEMLPKGLLEFQGLGSAICFFFIKISFYQSKLVSLLVFQNSLSLVPKIKHSFLDAILFYIPVCCHSSFMQSKLMSVILVIPEHTV